MTKTQSIPFTELKTLIERVGFVEKRVPEGRVFKHPEEGLLIYRRYGDHETVDMSDIVFTRKFLDMRGVMEADEFDAMLLRANTPA
jgi:hypothetical protein